MQLCVRTVLKMNLRLADCHKVLQPQVMLSGDTITKMIRTKRSRECSINTSSIVFMVYDIGFLCRTFSEYKEYFQVFETVSYSSFIALTERKFDFEK